MIYANIMRRVAGYHDIRLDGILDLVVRARGASVLDLGCNRGLVGFEMANNGAAVVHGCDIEPDCVRTAREVFADLRNVESRFEVVDLAKGPAGLKEHFRRNYDIVLLLATYHKLKRVMKPADLTGLVSYLGSMTEGYFGWRGTSDKHDESLGEMAALDRDLGETGLRRIHTSTISEQLGVAAIWSRI
jgi:SAM-dependent methyltransferase